MDTTGTYHSLNRARACQRDRLERMRRMETDGRLSGMIRAIGLFLIACIIAAMTGPKIGYDFAFIVGMFTSLSLVGMGPTPDDQPEGEDGSQSVPIAADHAAR